MKNFDLKQNINDVDASGRGLSSAPWNIFSNPFDNSQKVKSGQSGRSMIEMLGVLAIIGVLSVGGIAGYSKAMQKYRVNKTIEQITQVSQNIRTFFATQQNYNDLNVNVLKKANLIPNEMWNGDNLEGAFGSVSVVRSHGKVKKCINTAGCGAFYIEFSSVPQEVCIDLMTQDWGSISSGFVGLSTSPTFNGWLPDEGGYCNEQATSSGDAIVICKGGTKYGIPTPLDIAAKYCREGGVLAFKFE